MYQNILCHYQHKIVGLASREIGRRFYSEEYTSKLEAIPKKSTIHQSEVSGACCWV